VSVPSPRISGTKIPTDPHISEANIINWFELKFDFVAKEALRLKDDINKIAKIPKKGPVIRTKGRISIKFGVTSLN
jgi:hypothetical protein